MEVYRNDKIPIAKIENFANKSHPISRSPCNPNKDGISIDVINHFKGQIPLLGVCLGHQSIGQAFGGKVIHAHKIMHGKTSDIHHNNTDIFKGLEKTFIATRYHSLVIEKKSLPDCFEITAWTQNDNETMDEIMGLRHKELPISGVQFHPESILTSYGHELLSNFLKMY